MIILIGVGGIAGAYCRYYFGKWVFSKRATLFPLATFIINISGSFILGSLYSLHTQGHIPDWCWLIFGTGFCGAYTTFSTFGYETFQLLEKKKIGVAVAYIVLSIVFGLLFAWLGMDIG
jgi:CrcB protein